MRALCLAVLVGALPQTGCLPAPTADDAAGEGEGEGEGEANEGEGEGEDDAVARLLVQVDGIGVTSIDFGAVAAETLGQAGTTALRTVTLLPIDPSSSVALFTDPPILIGGLDAAAWSVVDQPAASVRPGGASFAVRFAPTTPGSLRGALLFATGTRASDRTVIPLAGEATGPVRVPGLRLAQFDGSFDLLPDFTTLRATSVGVSADVSIPLARQGTELFALLFVGAIDIPDSGDWSFFSTSDDGSRVIIDGDVVVDNDGLHGPLEIAGTTTLSAGPHALEIQFFEKTGGEVLTVQWQGPGRARESLPAGALFSTP